ncbi:MAG: hypothetical protein DWQ07_14130 [Chloroflexi bacterium]|nr:MAG: hypothetical protein DWQ07_14130 [Chloroflexota bacterium]
MEFLQTIETIQAEAADVQRLFNAREDGQGVRQAKGRKNPVYKKRLAEAAKLVADVYNGIRDPYFLREALSTSDFPQLFGDILDRQVLASYREWPRTYQNYVKTATVRDFRTVKRFRVDGGEGRLDEVDEQAAYPGSSLSDDEYGYAVKKHGRRMPFSWETMINDDLDALKDVPERFGRAARRTEEYFATTLWIDANGPHASLYAAGNNNIVTSNPALSIPALQTAMTVLAAQVDAEDEPIVVETVELVVAPALRITARNILNAIQLELTESGGSSDQKLIVENWMRNEVRLSVAPYIPTVASSANGNSTWGLFANPSDRPALEMGFLRGHTEPEVFIKAPNAMRAGGGSVEPMAGDFETDSIEYKVRHVVGGGRMDPKMTVASNGSGS